MSNVEEFVYTVHRALLGRFIVLYVFRMSLRRWFNWIKKFKKNRSEIIGKFKSHAPTVAKQNEKRSAMRIKYRYMRANVMYMCGI